MDSLLRWCQKKARSLGSTRCISDDVSTQYTLRNRTLKRHHMSVSRLHITVCILLCQLVMPVTILADELRVFTPRLEPRILKNNATQECLRIVRFSNLQSNTQAQLSPCTHSATTDGVIGETWIVTKASRKGWQIKSRRDEWCLSIEENIVSQRSIRGQVLT